MEGNREEKVVLKLRSRTRRPGARRDTRFPQYVVVHIKYIHHMRCVKFYECPSYSLESVCQLFFPIFSKSLYGMEIKNITETRRIIASNIIK